MAVRWHNKPGAILGDADGILGIGHQYPSGTIHGKQWLRNGLLLTVCLGLGLFALVLTGTRGTFLALLPLTLLMTANARSRCGQLYLLGAIVVLGGLVFRLSGSLQQRMAMLVSDLGLLVSGGVDAASASVGLRAKMWFAALDLAAAKPLFGYGIGTYPGILHDPSREFQRILPSISSIICTISTLIFSWRLD